MFTIIFNILHILLCLIVIAVVLLQAGRSAGISGAIAGGAETFFGKNKGRDIESKLSRYTGWCAIGFIVTSVVLVFLLRG